MLYFVLFVVFVMFFIDVTGDHTVEPYSSSGFVACYCCVLLVGWCYMCGVACVRESCLCCYSVAVWYTSNTNNNLHMC